ELVVGAAEGAAEPGAAAGALQDGQVEVAHVPAGQHVRIDAPHVGEEALEERALVGHHLGPRDVASGDHEDPLAARARHGERVEPLAVEARLDVEREHAEARCELGRRERGVPVDAPHARAPLEVALDREGATDTTVDQVAVRKAEVGLRQSTPASPRRLRTPGTSPGSATSTRTTGSPPSARSSLGTTRAPGASRRTAASSAARTKKYGASRSSMRSEERRVGKAGSGVGAAA